ncbi:recombinase family protein [Trinickia sp. Y13]|nr:recombinase family protein [Trinickia sp. Y13]MDG0027696.1 recombinase family protein [Trinickia sp. Y13]
MAERVSRPKTRAILGLMRLNFLSVKFQAKVATMAVGDPREGKTPLGAVVDAKTVGYPLIAAGVDPAHLYEDQASGKREDRPGLLSCLKALRPGDTLMVWKLDRLGRDLRHLINTVHDLTGRGIGLKVLTGHGAAIDTTTAAGKLVFGIFAALAEFERELITERTIAGLASARARGRKGGRPFKMTAAKLRLAMAAMGQPETKVGDLCQELGITRQTLYRHISPKGELRLDGEKLLSQV